MNPLPLHTELEFAQDFATDAVKQIRTLTARDLQVRVKPDRTLVTTADDAINDAFIDAVAARFTDDGVLGEESSRHAVGPRTWVIDPIDGTQQLVLGIPVYMVSIALVMHGHPVVAVAANPSTNELYWATTGGGAYRDGRRLSVSTRDGITEPALICGGGAHPTAPGLDADTLLRVTAQPRLDTLATRFPWPSVFSGCKVAEGQWDGDLYGQTAAHDVAATCLLVREAGGTVTDRNGNDQRYDRPVRGCVLSNGQLHDLLTSNWRPTTDE